MYTREESLVFQNFCQKIIEAPRPIESQPHEWKDGFLWCQDWYMIEILKYFFNGHDGYLGDPPPNRLKRNPLFSKDAIVADAQKLMAAFKTPEEIVNHLRQERDNARNS